MHNPQANKEVIADSFNQSHKIYEIKANNNIVDISCTLFI